MKSNKRLLTDQRKRIDQVLSSINLMGLLEHQPRKGWLKAVRESLGMTAQQLAKRIKLKNHASILAFEKREKEKTITLRVLEDAARAMGCRLVYAIVPEGKTLEQLVEARAQKIASQLVQKVSHSMKLENQGIDREDQEQQTKKLALELKEKLDPRLWD